MQKRKGQGRVGTREVEMDLSTRRKHEGTSGYKQNRGKLQRFHSSFQTPRSLQFSVFVSIHLMRNSETWIEYTLSYPTHTHNLQIGYKLRKRSLLSHRQKDNIKALSYSTSLLQSYVLPLEIVFVLPWLLLPFISTSFLLLAREGGSPWCKRYWQEIKRQEWARQINSSTFLPFTDRAQAVSLETSHMAKCWGAVSLHSPPILGRGHDDSNVSPSDASPSFLRHFHFSPVSLTWNCTFQITHQYLRQTNKQ